VWYRQAGSRCRCREALILCERSVDANVADPARFTGVSLADISRRDIARQKLSQGTNSRTPTVRSPIELVGSRRGRQDKGLKLQQNRNIAYLTQFSFKALIPIIYYGGIPKMMFGRRKKMEFPQRLARMRKERGLTQATLAEAVKVSAIQIKRYESGASQPTPTLS
jgi:DNA-binding XRE family transcriptional regulator